MKRLQNSESLFPIVAAKCEADREMRGWDLPPPTYQRVILEAITSDGINIPSVMPTSIHRFLYARNITVL